MDDASLMTVADVMMPTTVSVAAGETVAAAAEIVRRHQLPALPVVEGGRVVGLVTPVQLLREPVYRTIAELMTRTSTPATPDLTLLQAHALMQQQETEILPVVDGDRLVGQISLVAILRAQGQQTDPLTGLPWATALRAWAAAALARGHEIAVLFIDLDNFGAVNKTLGHVVGDDILRSMAHLLASLVDVSTDVLCRYGGDEFAIATTRREDEARALSGRIEETVVLPIEIGGEQRYITCSVGFAGGRRVEGRPPAHVAATVEDLLTLASRASTAAKEATERAARRGEWAEPPAAHGSPGTLEAAVEERPAGLPEVPPAEARLRLVEVMTYEGASGCTAEVTLRLGGREGAGRASGPVHGKGLLYLVAEATLAAIVQTAGDEHAYILEELTDLPSEGGKLVVAVLASPSNGTRFVGGACAVDLAQAVPKAILDALNRVLARPLAEILRRDASP